MSLITVMFAILIFSLCLGVAAWTKKRHKRLFFESHRINAEQLHAILFADKGAGSIQLIDVRQPLDMLAYSQIIPGAQRIAPREILANPDLLAKDQDTIVYCTCPSDETATKIMQKAVSLGFGKIKVLHGGLEAWKEKQYPVDPYESAFHLDTTA